MATLNVAFRDALKGVRLPTGDTVTLVVAPPPGDVVIRLDLDPSEAGAADDRFILSTKDGKYRQERTIRDDRVARDRFVDLRFTDLQKKGTYTLEHDPGREGTKTPVFSDVPYAELVGLSRDATPPATEAAGKGDLRVRLDLDPADAKSRDDRFTLSSTDGSFSQTKTVKDDLTPGDRFVDLQFTGLPTSQDFTLEVDLGKEGKPERVFENVPYGELAGMCWQHAPDEDVDAPAEGRLKVRLEIDPNEARSRDDRFTLYSSDDSYRVTKTVKDDLRAGDGVTDLVFTGMPTHLDYSLEVDLGKEGGPELVFEHVPYAELAHLSWQLPPDGDLDAEPEPDSGELKVRLDLDPNDAKSRDDRFTLFSTDKSFRQVKTVKDDRTPGDRVVDLLFTGLPKSLAYSLEVDLGMEGGPTLVFDGVPYAELADLSFQPAPDDLDEDPPKGHGDLCVRIDVDPEDADVHDDRITLRATDGSYTQTKVVRDDLTAGDGWVDLIFTKLPIDRDFTLEIDPGTGSAETVFERVPYAELAGLSWNVTHEELQ